MHRFNTVMTFMSTFLDSTFDSGLWSEWLLEVQGVHEVKRCPSECRIVLRKRFLLGQIQQVFCQLEHFFETLSESENAHYWIMYPLLLKLRNVVGYAIVFFKGTYFKTIGYTTVTKLRQLFLSCKALNHTKFITYLPANIRENFMSWKISRKCWKRRSPYSSNRMAVRCKSVRMSCWAPIQRCWNRKLVACIFVNCNL